MQRRVRDTFEKHARTSHRRGREHGDRCQQRVFHGDERRWGWASGSQELPGKEQLPLAYRRMRHPDGPLFRWTEALRQRRSTLS